MTSLPGLLLGALILALIELDETAAGQFMISRPIVLGPLAGAAFGDALLGGGLGLLFELFSLVDPPVGGYLPINPSVALSGALLFSASGGGPTPAGFALGLVLGWIHGLLETTLRRRRVSTARRAEKRLAAGEEPRLMIAAAVELARQAAFTFFLLAAAVLVRRAFLQGWLPQPWWLSAGLRAGLALAPWIGLGALCRALRLA